MLKPKPPHKAAYDNLQKIIDAVAQLRQLEAENEARIAELASELVTIPNYGAMLAAAELDKITAVDDPETSAARIASIEAERATVSKRKTAIDAELSRSRHLLADIRSRIASHVEQLPELREIAREKLRAHLRPLLDAQAKKWNKIKPEIEAIYIEMNAISEVMGDLGGGAAVSDFYKNHIELPYSDEFGEDGQKDGGKTFRGCEYIDAFRAEYLRLEAIYNKEYPAAFLRERDLPK